jgi:hypothetical protein
MGIIAHDVDRYEHAGGKIKMANTLEYSILPSSTENAYDVVSKN